MLLSNNDCLNNCLNNDSSSSSYSGRPLVGIAPGYSYKDQNLYIFQGYVNAINKAGGIAVLLSATDDEDLIAEYLKRCDAILLPGGPDLDARYYKEDNYTYNGTVNPIRDAMEICIARKAVEMGKPLLGICRGIQVINAALGGTLYQDINSQLKEQKIVKHYQNAPGWYPIHDIYIERNSIIYQALNNACTAAVNSYHHQAIKDVAPGFSVTSRAPDGVIESIEYRKGITNTYGKPKFVVGVQWHPEEMWEKDPVHLNLFKQLVNAAKSL